MDKFKRLSRIIHCIFYNFFLVDKANRHSFFSSSLCWDIQENNANQMKMWD